MAEYLIVAGKLAIAAISFNATGQDILIAPVLLCVSIPRGLQEIISDA